jgi:uncharacterized delta-60 repeat protein
MIKKLSVSLSFLIISCTFLTSQVTQQWVTRYSGSGNNYDRANNVKVDASGNIYVTGSTAVVSSNWDYITIKYNTSGVQQWVRTYNGPGNTHDQSYSLALDNSGNIYITGGSFGNGTERDFCTIKYNSNGDSLWVRRYNGPGNDIDEAISIAVGESNHVYVAGYSDGGQNLDYNVLKYDSSGTLIWGARYNFPAPGTGSEDRPHYMALDGTDNVYVTGESNTGFGFLDMYATVKYNSSGVQQWVARYKGSGDSGLSQAYSLAVDPSGNVYVTGRSDPSSGFGFNFDIATIKYNSSGDSLWVRRYNGPANSSDIGNSIALDANGNVIVTGASASNFITIKYNSAGVIIWNSEYNGPGNGVDNAASMVTDLSGNIYVTGYSVGTGTLRDYAVVKYNSSGVQQWIQRYNGPGNNEDEARAITIDNAGNVYVTGISTGTGTGMDFATIKYSQPITSIPSLSEFPESFVLYQNYPNPFNPATNIKFSIPKNGEVSLKIYDIAGNEIATYYEGFIKAGIYNAEVNASNWASGVYFYTLRNSEFTDTKKMILLK